MLHRNKNVVCLRSSLVEDHVAAHPAGALSRLLWVVRADADRALDPVDVALPVGRKIENGFTKTSEGYTLTLKSAASARSVYVSFGDLNVLLSDNYFDLLPNEEVKITLKTLVPLDQIQRTMKNLFSHRCLCQPGTH
jgi:hypothetical protein